MNEWISNLRDLKIELTNVVWCEVDLVDVDMIPAFKNKINSSFRILDPIYRIFIGSIVTERISIACKSHISRAEDKKHQALQENHWLWWSTCDARPLLTVFVTELEAIKLDHSVLSISWLFFCKAFAARPLQVTPMSEQVTFQNQHWTIAHSKKHGSSWSNDSSLSLHRFAELSTQHNMRKE